MEKEKIPTSIEGELSQLRLGEEFNTMDPENFISLLRKRVKENPLVRFSITANWVDASKARQAKSLLDMHGTRLHIDSIIIRATRAQYDEDVNAFQSGVQWEKIPN